MSKEEKKKANALGASHLANARLNLVALREIARKEMVKLLDSVRGEIALVVDKPLSGPLNLVAEVDLLRQHGVREFHYLQTSEIRTEMPNIVFLTRPTIKLMRMIAAHVFNMRKSDKGRKTYSVFFVPRRTMVCERTLMEEKVFGDLRLAELNLDLIPFEEDVLSLEMKYAFKECYLDGDPTSLYFVAKSLMKLQSVFGLIPNIKGKGNGAQRVWKLMQRMRRETPNLPGFNTVPEIDTLILIDRSVDLVTPLLTQMTYEGLIDEVFGINNNILEVDAEVLGEKEASSDSSTPSAGGSSAASPPRKKRLVLNSFDTLYKEIRDVNFRVLGPILHKRAEQVSQTYGERHKAQSVGEMHAFMQKFKSAHQEHTMLQTHINLAERISQVVKSKLFDKKLDMEWAMLEGRDLEAVEDYIEACIARQDPLLQVLRLLCLLSLTLGVRPKKFDQFRRDLLQTYGFELLFTLSNLERLGLFARAGKRSPHQALKKMLRLVLENKEEVDWKEPRDISFAYGGYAPLSVRLIELANKPGWSRIPDVLEAIPGATFEEEQQLTPALAERLRMNASAAGAASPLAQAAADRADTVTRQGAAPLKEEKKGGLGLPLPGINIGGILGSSSQAAIDAALSGAEGKSGSGGQSGGSTKKPLTLVYFLGGVTFAEIAALRFLSEKEGHGREYMIATTKLINGNSLIDSVRERVQNNLDRRTAFRE